MILQIISAFIAIAAFSIFMSVPRKHVVWCGLLGAGCWLIYLRLSGLPHTCQNVEKPCNCIPDPKHPPPGARSISVPRRISVFPRNPLPGKSSASDDAGNCRGNRSGHIHRRFTLYTAQAGGKKQKIAAQAGIARC